MLYRDIFVAERLRFILREIQDVIQFLADIRPSALNLRQILHQLQHRILEVRKLDLHFRYKLRQKSILLCQQSVKEVFLVDLLVAMLGSCLFGKLNRFDGFLSKFLNIHRKYLLF